MYGCVLSDTRFLAPAASEIFGFISVGLIYRHSGIPDCLALYQPVFSFPVNL